MPASIPPPPSQHFDRLQNVPLSYIHINFPNVLPAVASRAPTPAAAAAAYTSSNCAHCKTQLIGDIDPTRQNTASTTRSCASNNVFLHRNALASFALRPTSCCTPTENPRQVGVSAGRCDTHQTYFKSIPGRGLLPVVNAAYRQW